MPIHSLCARCVPNSRGYCFHREIIIPFGLSQIGLHFHINRPVADYVKYTRTLANNYIHSINRRAMFCCKTHTHNKHTPVCTTFCDNGALCANFWRSLGTKTIFKLFLLLLLNRSSYNRIFFACGPFIGILKVSIFFFRFAFEKTELQMWPQDGSSDELANTFNGVIRNCIQRY
jgi:hypothetical protein